ncbi:MAG: glycosyltransferase family 4 protein [Bacteroidales bacterium]|nr:glycosyltransferase family 4 protein [Bacteroidales bacterium]
MVGGLHALGVDIVVAGPTPKEYFIDKINQIGARYYSICIAESVYPTTASNHLMVFLRIINLIRRKIKSYSDILRVVRVEHPNIIHTNVGTIHEGLAVAKRFKIPHIWHVREYQRKDSKWSPFPSLSYLKKKFKDSNVVAISKGLICYYSLENNPRAIVIYNGISSETSENVIWPRDNHFISASRISEEKKIDDMIRAFSLFYADHRDYRLVIFGDGNDMYVNALKDLTKQLNCEEGVEWRGYSNNVMEYMRRATGLIVASYNEGFGRMTAEACIAGCLVIGRNSGGTKEIIEQTGGFLFDSVEELYQDMVTLSKYTMNDYIRVSSSAQKVAINSFSIDNNVRSIMELYHNIIG